MDFIFKLVVVILKVSIILRQPVSIPVLIFKLFSECFSFLSYSIGILSVTTIAMRLMALCI